MEIRYSKYDVFKGDFMYENLLEEARNKNISVMENAPFRSQSDGLINGNTIGINRTVRSARRRACVLAEELGHYHTTVGDIVIQSTDDERRQEHRARVWAYERLIGLTGIINSYKRGCLTLYETADYLDVTEDFLADALQYYKGRYGTCTTLDNYVIYFEPSIGVFERI